MFETTRRLVDGEIGGKEIPDRHLATGRRAEASVENGFDDTPRTRSATRELTSRGDVLCTERESFYVQPYYYGSLVAHISDRCREYES
ncbi:MAG: hypothetical protein ABUL53_10885, partial [Bradyrhizobium guangdongense]